MPVTIGELTTEVIADLDAAAGDAPAQSPESAAPAAALAELAALMTRKSRTRAEGFDD